MADDDLGITGKDVTWEMLIDGAPQGIVGEITNWTERARFDTVERKHVGTTDVDIDKIPIGWEGDFEITAKDGVLEDAVDAYIAAKKARVPINTVFHVVKRYRDGSSRRHTYRQCQWEFETTGSRAESVVHRVTWTSGVDRL